jgi:hypothetical protein
MAIKLGQMVSFYVDADNDITSENAHTQMRGRVVALHRTDPKRFIIGWKDVESAPNNPDECDPEPDHNFRKVSNYKEYAAFISSWDFADDTFGENIIMKALGDVREDISDAAWRQAVEQVVTLGQEHAVKQLGGVLGSARAKTLGILLATKEGRHVVAYLLGVAIEALPYVSDDRVSRLAKELRVYGLEVFTGYLLKAMKDFVKDATKLLPKEA